jgi:polysaccharide export outer membrane protein
MGFRFFCFTSAVFFSLFTINNEAAAQNAQSSAPGQSAGQQLQNDAARVAGTSANVMEKTQETTVPGRSGISAAAESAAPQMRIGGGDLLNISVYGVPELAQDVRVNNSGEVYLPLIGYVQLAGLTLDQAQTVIENRLREGEFVKSPHVTVFLKEYVNQSATVTGEVARPGVYPVLGTRRLLEVLAAAGGLTPRAGKTVTITHRDHPDEPVKLDLPANLEKSPKDNVEIFPGDTLVVNRAGVVYVVGEVVRPAGLIMDNNEKMTVIQAIALAGGTTSVAAMNSARLIRATAKGREEVQLQLKKMLSSKQADIDLKPDDIIFVPTSFGKKAARRSAESALALTTQVALYHP